MMSYLESVPCSASWFVRVRRSLDRRSCTPFCCAWLLGTPGNSCAPLLARQYASTPARLFLRLWSNVQGSRLEALGSQISDLSSPNAKRQTRRSALCCQTHNSDESLPCAPALSWCSQPALQACSEHLFSILQSERGLTDGLTFPFQRHTGHLEAFLGMSAHLMRLEWSSIHNSWLYMLQGISAYHFRIMQRYEWGSSRQQKGIKLSPAALASNPALGHCREFVHCLWKLAGGAEVVARTSLLAWSLGGFSGLLCSLVLGTVQGSVCFPTMKREVKHETDQLCS